MQNLKTFNQLNESTQDGQDILDLINTTEIGKDLKALNLIFETKKEVV